jgi:hypothetical protein
MLLALLDYLYLLFLYSLLLSTMQIVSAVLDMVPSSYGIRLAALASRKELVDLEKWLSYNLNTYKDNFFEVIIGCPCICCLLYSADNCENATFWYILNIPLYTKNEYLVFKCYNFFFFFVKINKCNNFFKCP